MAKYNINNIKENNDFLEFINSEYGYDNFDKIPLWEQNAIFYKFKARENDIDNDDFAYLEENKNNQSLEAVSKEYYPNKEFSELGLDDVAFVQAMAKDLSQPNMPTLAEIHAQRINDGEYNLGVSRQHYTRDNLEQILKAHDLYMLTPEELEQNTELKNMTDEERANHTTLFVETIEQAKRDIAEYANGDLTIDADAHDAMQKYIETFGKEWQNGQYILTPEAEKALDKLESANKDIFTFGQENDNKNNVKLDDKVLVDDENIKGIAGIVNEPQSNDDGINGISSNPVFKEEMEEIRILSMFTDDNKIVFNKLQLDVLEAMNVVSTDNANEARQDALRGDFDKLFDLAEQADGLSGDNRRKYDVNIAETILNNEQNTEWVPPSVLADIHDSLKNYISEDKKKDENADTSVLQGLLDKTNTQIDKLSEDMSKKRGYQYSDVTNIADIYNGYDKMFKARKTDFGEQPTSDEQAKITQMDGNMSTLSQLRDGYDERWGIKDLSPKDDSRIASAYDKAFKQLENPELDNETLKLLEKVTFLDADGKKENQFTDDGKIIENSKLDKLIKQTANDVAMKAMSNKQELSAEQLNANMQETLLTNLHAVNVVEKSYQQNNKEIHIEKDELNPDKNTSYVQRFKTELENGNGIEISDAAFVGWKRYNINSAKNFADRLSEKLEAKNATAVEKIYGRVAGIDGVSGERPREKMNAKEFRKYATKRLAKDFLMSAGIGAGFTVLTGALRAKLGATVAVGVGVAVGIGATAAMVYKRKKDAKKKGEKYGWRQFFKDPQALIAVGTTVCASMAVATAPISPKLSGVLGYSAIALGTGGKGIDMFQKSQNDAAGIPKWEGFLWAAADAGLTLGGAMAGRAAGQAAMNAWNNAFPDNNLFRENVGVETKEITEVQEHTERQYDPKVVETYKNACENWVDNETLMKMHDDAIAKGMTSDEFWIKAHHSMVNNPDGVPAEFGTNRAYVNNTVTGTDFKTVDNLKITHTDNHNLMGDLARKEFNFSIDSQRAAASFLDFHNGTVNNTPEVNEALRLFDDIATRTGGVGNVSTTPHIVGHGLPQNAGYNTSSGALELDAPAGSEKTYTSYANDGKIYVDKVVTTTNVNTETVDRYETVKGIPALVGLVNAGRKLKDRMGALADRLFNKTKPIPTPAPTPGSKLTPTPVPTPNKKSQPEPKLTPTPVATPNKKSQPEPKLTPTPVATPNKKSQPEPKPKLAPKQGSTKLLMDEYKIVYGIEPNTTEGKNAAWKAYCARVEEERKVGAPDKSMDDFLLARRATLDKVVEDNVPGETAVNESGTPIRSDYLSKRAKDDRGKAGVIMEARQNLMQSNLTTDNFRNKITLSHFTKFVSHFIKRDEVVADGSRNIALNPKLKDKYKKEGSKVAIVDLNQYLVDGKPLEECKEKVSGKDMRQAMSTLHKNNERA